MGVPSRTTAASISQPIFVGTLFDVIEPSEVAVAITEQVSVEVMGAQEGAVPDLKIDSPNPANVVVTVYVPVELATAQFVSTPQELEHVIDLGSRPLAAAEIAPHLYVVRPAAGGATIAVSAEVEDALARTRTDVGPGHEPWFVGPEIGWNDSVLGRTPTILVPVQIGSHRVSVEVVQDPGMVGYGCGGQQSVEAITNRAGIAHFRISAGNQAGRLELKIGVRRVGDGMQVATKIVELWIKPSDDGRADTLPLRAPQLAVVG